MGNAEYVKCPRIGDLVDQIVWRIAESHLDLDDTTPKPLSALKEIKLADQHMDDFDGEDHDIFKVFASFGLLPAVRRFSRTDVPSCISSTEPIWLPATETSYAIDLNLQQSDLLSESLVRILERISSLRNFTYDSAHLGLDNKNTFALIIQTLRKYTATSLEYLALAFKTSSKLFMENEDAGMRYFKDFKDFKVLKDVILPSRLYVEDTLLRRWYSVALDNEIRHTVRLIDILPASIQTIQLDGRIDIGHVVCMLTDVPERKAECFPNLTRIHYTEFESEPEDSENRERVWVEKCRNVGVEMVL